MANDAARVELTEQSKRLLARMKTVDMAKDLRRELMASTAGAVPAVRQAARAMPSKRKRAGTKAGSLRSAVAMAAARKILVTGKQITALIKIVPHGGKANLSRAVEGEIPWHHPVYGHEPDIDQESHPFFYRTMEKIAPLVDARIRAVFNSFEKKF